MDRLHFILEKSVVSTGYVKTEIHEGEILLDAATAKQLRLKFGDSEWRYPGLSQRLLLSRKYSWFLRDIGKTDYHAGKIVIHAANTEPTWLKFGKEKNVYRRICVKMKFMHGKSSFMLQIC